MRYPSLAVSISAELKPGIVKATPWQMATAGKWCKVAVIIDQAHV